MGYLTNNYSNSISGNSAEAKVAMDRMARDYGGTIDMKSYLYSTGANVEDVTQQIGIELGINKDGYDNNLSFDSYVSSATDQNNFLFQSEDGNLHNLDFTSDKFVSQSTEQFAKDNGLIVDGKKVYDVVDFGQNHAAFTNYSILSGEQTSVSINLGNPKWSNIDWTLSRIDSSYWGRGGSDREAVKSNRAFSNILEHAEEWLTYDDYAQLDKCESEEEELALLKEWAEERFNGNDVQLEDEDVIA